MERRLFAHADRNHIERGYAGRGKVRVLMARLSIEDAQRVAKLAALELTDQDAHAMRDQLEKILEHIAALEAVDVAGVEPTFHPFASEAPLRTDVAVLSGLREELLAAAPRIEGPGFAVPKVLDGD